jgi:4'-phosphopantetheinyl transferase
MSNVAFLYYLLSASLSDKNSLIRTPEEQNKTTALALQRHRNERVLSCAILRRALSDLTGLHPLIWQFRRNAYGRPEIEAPSQCRRLKFSVSHAGRVIACLLSWHREVGLDVEPFREVNGMLKIADQYFAPFETASLRALPSHEQSRRFLELWTLKESYLKARGCGLSIPLAAVAFIIRKDAAYQIHAMFGAELKDDPARWQFDLELVDDHLIAITAERRRRARVKIIVRNAIKLMN